MLENIRIVLVRPIRPGNVGAVCRAMVNMGLSDLAIVEPACALDDPQALGFAARAKHMLAKARLYGSIGEALEGTVKSYAATGKGGLYRKQAGLTAAAAGESAIEDARHGRVAVAFGPEDRGLVMRELLEFDQVVEIPTNPEYPAMNLAAAAAVVCYELRHAYLRREEDLTPTTHGEPLASDERKRIMYEKLFDSLDTIGFFGGQQNPDHLKYALRRILGRTRMTVNEADILIGMTQQIRWYAERYPRMDKADG